MIIEHPTVIPDVAASAPPSVEPPYSLPRILLGVVLAVATFDLCFWGANGMGFSVAVFTAVLAAVILANREKLPWRRTTLVLGMLLAGGCWAAVVEAGTTNTIVLIILTIALAGDTYFDKVEAAWARWFSQFVALVFAPGRLFWLTGRLLDVSFDKGTSRATTLIGGCLLAVPALVLAVVFGGLLASGNAVFGNWTSLFFNWLWSELGNILNPGRIFVWLLVAFLVLPFLRPARIARGWWEWIPRLPRLPELISPGGATFSSALVLLVLNLLFLAANAADAMFLWSGVPVPVGVEQKTFVHEGIDTLIFTVILTAVVLTAIFQQEINVSSRAPLKVLAFFWIAQNVFLLSSCALRLKNYVDDSQLTVARLSCLIFLMLVAVGFLLLAIKILREHSIAWLIGRCLVAVFVTFYLTQFLDLAGWATNYNVARLERDHMYKLDTWKLYEAGPAGWPAAARAHAVDSSITVLNADPNRGPVTEDDLSRAI
jgi:hypothetical protein